jgi:hypothetical protein
MLVEQAAEPVASALRAAVASLLGRWPKGWLEPERAVGPGRVVVVGVLAQHTQEVALTRDQEPVQALAADERLPPPAAPGGAPPRSPGPARRSPW